MEDKVIEAINHWRNKNKERVTITSQKQRLIKVNLWKLSNL